MRFIDLTGKKFGRLLVISLQDRNKGKLKWLCQCDCGNTTVALGSNLKNGHTSSCGCLHREKSSSKAINIAGFKFGRLTAISKNSKSEKNKHTKWLCQCDCGNFCVVDLNDLRRGATQSCGCLQKERTRETKLKHGLVNSKLYITRRNMCKRCYDKQSKDYEYYGGRGITVCDEWLNKDTGFINFYNWAMENGYEEGLSIDRIDNDGNYEPSNCRWVTLKQQANNKRNNVMLTYKGETHNITTWGKILGIKNSIIRQRINRGWSVEKALCTQVQGVS